MIFKNSTQKYILFCVISIIILSIISFLIWNFFSTHSKPSVPAHVVTKKYENTILDTGITINVNMPDSYGFNLRVITEGPDVQRSILGGVGFIPVFPNEAGRPFTISAGVMTIEKVNDLHSIVEKRLLYPIFGVQDTSMGSYVKYGSQEFFIHEEPISPQRTILRAISKYDNKVVLVTMIALDTQEYHYIFEDRKTFFENILSNIKFE